MTGCEMIKCPDFIDGKCHSLADYVNSDSGEDMCFRNNMAIPRKEYEYAKNTEQQVQSDNSGLPPKKCMICSASGLQDGPCCL